VSPRERVQIPPPREHGGDAATVAAALGLPPDALLDLSVSANPAAPDVVAIATRHVDALRRYPDVPAAERLLAEAVGVDPDRCVLTAGGSAAIALVAAERPRGSVVEPEFSLYRRHLAEVHAGAPRWMSDPNNPTGRLARPDERAAVRDEAFYPLATGRWTRGDGDAVVVGSLTKLFACPGLRLGYAVTPDPDEAERLRRRRPEWGVDGLAAAALPDLLERADLAAWADQIAKLRAELVDLLTRQGFAVEPSDAPWVLARHAAGLRSRLAPLGVLVRDCTSFGLPDAARIAVPDAAGLDRLAPALTALEGS
jgi:histidinol-phosphate/aromatic aminotransferase/cobyric acid decarboxylase-like protein